MPLVSTALSRRGFEKVQEIMEGDEVLKANERNNPLFGKDLYFISILGTPSVTAPWMLQCGGHHLALNVTIVGEEGVLTPSLTAAQPALYTVNGKSVRPLGQENDKAFALLAALNAAADAREPTSSRDRRVSRQCTRADRPSDPHRRAVAER